MNPAPGSVFCEPQLAAKPQLREKPRQGFETWKTAWKPSPNVVNSTVAMGIRAGLVLGGVRKTYRARYYNPTTGRFLSEDPIGFAGGMNLYEYAANNPMRFKDPFGRCPDSGPLSGRCENDLALFVLGGLWADAEIYLFLFFAPQLFFLDLEILAEMEELEGLAALGAGFEGAEMIVHLLVGVTAAPFLMMGAGLSMMIRDNCLGDQ
jgi:hypothetical protein